MGKLTEVFFALSNKNRLDIYNLVLKKERNITQISEELDQKYPNVLKSLKILEGAEMITLNKKVTKKSQETFVKGIPFQQDSVYHKVYLKLLAESEE